VTGLNGGSQLSPDLYNIENCGLTGAHYFRLGISNSSSTAVTWRWYLDGNPIGPGFTLPYYHTAFARNRITATSEIVQQGPSSPNAAWPTVHYFIAMKYERLDGVWVESQNAKAIMTDINSDHFAMKVIAPDDFKTGAKSAINPTVFYSNGQWLW
jgi:hypothetical protein